MRERNNLSSKLFNRVVKQPLSQYERSNGYRKRKARMGGDAAMALPVWREAGRCVMLSTRVVSLHHITDTKIH